MQNHFATGTTNSRSDAKLGTVDLADLSDSQNESLLFAANHGACFLSNKNNLMPSLGLYGQAGDDSCSYMMVWQHADSPLLLREGRGACIIETAIRL